MVTISSAGSHFQVQGHIYGQVVTLYQIYCTKTNKESSLLTAFLFYNQKGLEPANEFPRSKPAGRSWLGEQSGGLFDNEWACRSCLRNHRHRAKFLNLALFFFCFFYHFFYHNKTIISPKNNTKTCLTSATWQNQVIHIKFHKRRIKWNISFAKKSNI